MTAKISIIKADKLPRMKRNNFTSGAEWTLVQNYNYGRDVNYKTTYRQTTNERLGILD